MSDTHKKNHAALHIVEKTMTTDQLIKNLYKSPNTLTIEHFKMVNSHLKNNIADIGQVVLVSPPGAQSCTREEAAFQDTAREVDKTLAKLDKQERRVLAEKYDFLSTIASTSGTCRTKYKRPTSKTSRDHSKRNRTSLYHRLLRN